MAKHEYRIVTRKTQGDLAEAVEAFLNAGWQLAGGFFVEQRPDGSRIFYKDVLRITLAPSIGKEAVMDHVTGEVIYSEN